LNRLSLKDTEKKSKQPNPEKEDENHLLPHKDNEIFFSYGGYWHLLFHDIVVCLHNHNVYFWPTYKFEIMNKKLNLTNYK
jgi:hypothetical protein